MGIDRPYSLLLKSHHRVSKYYDVFSNFFIFYVLLFFYNIIHSLIQQNPIEGKQ